MAETKKSEKKSSRLFYPADATIHLLVKEPQHREKSKARKYWNFYKEGMTVGEWREKVHGIAGDIGYLHGAVNRKQIEVRMPKEKKEPERKTG